MAKDAQKLIIKDRRTARNESGIRELDLQGLSKIPLADYYRFADKIVNVENHVYYDTVAYAAGAITPQNTGKLFTLGQSEATSVVNTGTAIAEKGRYMTNMIGNGEFDNSTTFLLEMIAVQVFLPAERATTRGTKNSITDPTHNALATYSAPLHYEAIMNQFELQFLRSEQLMTSGLLFEFPSPFVASGAFGSSLGGFIQNGFAAPTWNKLSELHVLKSQDRFGVNINCLEAFTPQVPFNIRVAFIGKRIQVLYS